MYTYRTADRLPQLYACEHVFDRRIVIVAFEHDFNKSGCATAAQSHGLPCVRTRDLTSVNVADTVFILDADCFYGLREFVIERLEQKCTVHLLNSNFSLHKMIKIN